MFSVSLPNTGNFRRTSYSVREGNEMDWHRSQRHEREAEQEEVEFEKKIPSLSVVHGSEARMKCSVKGLGGHEVS